MRRRIVHQWRDWILEYVADNSYELTQKTTQEIFSIMAKDSMDAENKSQEIIKNNKQ